MPRKKKREDGTIACGRGDRGFKFKKTKEEEQPTKWRRKPAKKIGKKGKKGTETRWVFVRRRQHTE